jgi:hypothetical protein
MIELAKWSVPAEVSGRIYHRYCIKLPNLNFPVDINLSNSNEEREKIGEAYLLENEYGLYAKDIKWFVDFEYLNNIRNKSMEYFIQKYGSLRKRLS